MDLDSCASSGSGTPSSIELAFAALGGDGGDDHPSWRHLFTGRDCNDPLQCFLPSPFSASSFSPPIIRGAAAAAAANPYCCLAAVSLAESIKRQVGSSGGNWSSALGSAISGSSILGRRRSGSAQRRQRRHGFLERLKQQQQQEQQHDDDDESSIPSSSGRNVSSAGGADQTRSLKRDDRLDAVKTSKHLLAGALSACISRTLVAPLERLKLEYIVRGATSDVAEVMSSILSSEGVKGFWKGNLVNLIRTAPFKSINFYAYDTLRKRMTTLTGRDDVTPLEKLAAGATAGIFATILCFPMDTIRTRLVAQGGDALGGISGCFHHLISSQGFASLYAGIVPAIVSMAPAGAVFYGVYDILKTSYLSSPAGQEEQRKRLSGGRAGRDQMELGPLRTLLYGAIAGACAETVTYPLEVVRRNLQMQDAASRLGLMRTVQGLVKQGGVGALYAGILPSTLQVLPSAALSYFVYEWMKVTMKVS